MTQTESGISKNKQTSFIQGLYAKCRVWRVHFIQARATLQRDRGKIYKHIQLTIGNQHTYSIVKGREIPFIRSKVLRVIPTLTCLKKNPHLLIGSTKYQAAPKDSERFAPTSVIMASMKSILKLGTSGSRSTSESFFFSNTTSYQPPQKQNYIQGMWCC